MAKLGGVKIIVDGQVYRCMTFKVNFVKGTITILNPDGRNVRHDVRDWHSFSAHAVLVQDVDQYMAEQALDRVPHRKSAKQNSEEKIMQNFVDLIEDEEGKIHLILADITRTEGKDIERMIDILGIDPDREIAIEQATSSDGRYSEGEEVDDEISEPIDGESQEGGPEDKYRIFECDEGEDTHGDAGDDE